MKFSQGEIMETETTENAEYLDTEHAQHFDDDGTPIAEPCPNCKGTDTYFDFDRWKCEDCSTVWE
ncbi:hypothetical protein QUA70_19795 [Microcoleus sp. LAD1_D5]|uniref:hypothetical protein n=1 Tax=Microcoleus sp. LAD1_D5 TaxID=2818813 RepID=UPI002FD0DBB4